MILLYNIMVNSSGHLDAVFAALSDPTRRRIVERLARGSLTVGEIAADFPISQPAISRHVRVLEDAGLLERDVVGRIHHCSLTPDAIERAAAWIRKQTTFWTGVLDRLGDVVNESPVRKRKSR
jgi:DNA-binding transcriptional ArsR family regulator